MKPNLPNWLFLVGLLALGLSNTTKELAPQTLGRITALHWGCAIVSAWCFSIGLLVSIRGLFVDPARPRRFLLPLYCNLFFLVLLPTIYFAASVFASKFYQFVIDVPSPDFLPKLITASQTLDSAKKRSKAAEGAFLVYGVRLVYRDDAGNLIGFTPSVEDEKSFANQRDVEAKKQMTLAQVKGAVDQYPYLFSFYMGAFLITFIVGPLCFAFRRTTALKT
jgi:hypothetical protein